MKPLPRTAEALVEELDELYPPRCIGRNQSPEDAHRYAGARELVEKLLQRRDAIQETLTDV